MQAGWLLNNIAAHSEGLCFSFNQKYPPNKVVYCTKTEGKSFNELWNTIPLNWFSAHGWKLCFDKKNWNFYSEMNCCLKFLSFLPLMVLWHKEKKKSKTHILQNQCIFIKFLFFLKDVPNIGDGIFAAIVSKIE